MLFATAMVELVLIFLHLKLLSIVPLGIALAAAPDLDNFRRAIIFTPAAVRYRPTFGRLREIPVREILLASRTAVREGSHRTPINVLAAELTLSGGEVVLLSLSMDKGEEALQRLLEIAQIRRP